MRLILTMLTLCLVAGCAANQPYRDAAASQVPCQLEAPQLEVGKDPVWESVDGRCKKSWAVRSVGPGKHGVNYVEIDEQGIIGSRQAMEDAIRFAREPGPDGKPAYVVVFIHGWHHNAAEDDTNVQAFHSALASVSEWHPENSVRGIYIGWRGTSLDVPLLRYATFWDRKNTSDEVGRGGLLEFLLRLERAVQPEKAVQPGPASRNRLVLIGHSFGASVAFNALAHVYLERFLEGVHSTAAEPRFRGYGDLVVLINPAIEAMRFMPFQSALQYYSAPGRQPHADFSFETVPRLVILSSEGDWATRKTFPAARFFSTALEAHRRVSELQSPAADGQYVEWNMDIQTVGNFELFHTHSTLRLASAQAASSKLVANPPTERGGLKACKNLSKAVVRDLLSVDAADASPGRAFPDSNLQLNRRASTLKNTPYLLASVDTRIVSGHSDIGNPNLICWIKQLADGG